ncbi:MAG: hypothetical protein L6W00_26230 [Lentisphaeria bacterium]|nr:MAG: hypothetical protein L6W00_26230 [Lentisphaeria bacterium]
MKMDIEELFPEAEQYFATHLDSAEWNALPEERRRGALVTAEVDLVALTGNRLDPENVRHRNAVFEQALYLTRLPSPADRFSPPRRSAGWAAGAGRDRSRRSFRRARLRLLDELLRPEPHLLRG